MNPWIEMDTPTDGRRVKEVVSSAVFIPTPLGHVVYPKEQEM